MENVNEPDRERAIALGQILMNRGIIRHVTNTQPFADANYFYKFIMDDKLPVKKMEHELTPTEIKKISTAFQNPRTGIKLKDRREFIHIYKDTFLGSEAKAWMVNYLPGKMKVHAEEILQTLKDQGVFYSPKKSNGPFRSDKELYVFK